MKLLKYLQLLIIDSWVWFFQVKLSPFYSHSFRDFRSLAADLRYNRWQVYKEKSWPDRLGGNHKWRP